jgi:hypothetical protein
MTAAVRPPRHLNQNAERAWVCGAVLTTGRFTRRRSCANLESLPTVWIVRESSGEDLESDDAIEPAVERAIHLPHSSGTEKRADFVRAERRLDWKGHVGGWGIIGEYPRRTATT